MGDEFFLDYRSEAIDIFHEADALRKKAIDMSRGIATSGGENLKQAIETLNKALEKRQEGKEKWQKFLNLFAVEVDKGRYSDKRLEKEVKDLDTVNYNTKVVAIEREKLIKKYNSMFPDKAIPIPDRLLGGKIRKTRKHKRRARKTRRT